MSKRPALIVPTHLTPAQALAVFELLDVLRDRVWAMYGPHIQQAMRKDQRTTTHKSRRATDQRDLPF